MKLCEDCKCKLCEGPWEATSPSGAGVLCLQVYWTK